MLVARCSPLSTVIDEVQLSKGYSSKPLQSFAVEGVTNIERKSSPGTVFLREFTIEQRANLRFSNLLPYRETFEISYSLPDDSEVSNNLMISVNGIVLGQEATKKLPIKKILVAAPARSPVLISFTLIGRDSKTRESTRIRIVDIQPSRA